jgi:hypothetical protein
MPKKILFLLLAVLISCNFSIGQDIPALHGYQLIDWHQEDMDQNGLMEMVAIFKPVAPDKSGIFKKELIFYHWNGEKWVEQLRTGGPFLPNQGELDPYRGMEINGQNLSIRHADKNEMIWQTVDDYQLKGHDFQLINYTHTSFILCQTLQIMSLNTLTGKGMVIITNETCEENPKAEKSTQSEEFSINPLELTLSNRYSSSPNFQTPKLKVKFSLSPI